MLLEGKPPFFDWEDGVTTGVNRLRAMVSQNIGVAREENLKRAFYYGLKDLIMRVTGRGYLDAVELKALPGERDWYFKEALTYGNKRVVLFVSTTKVAKLLRMNQNASVTKREWERFKFSLLRMLTHEAGVHTWQLDRGAQWGRSFDDIDIDNDDPNKIAAYLLDPHEIQAYAHDIALELRQQGIRNVTTKYLEKSRIYRNWMKAFEPAWSSDTVLKRSNVIMGQRARKKLIAHVAHYLRQ